MTDNIDYLTEDPVLSEQKFVCVSFLKPSAVDDKNKDKKITVCGFKVRGSYSSYEEAQARATFLQKCDQYHNIYVAEVGKWCPFEDDPEKAKSSEYMNKDLNKLMKSYMEQQNEAKEFHELRKQQMVQNALAETQKKKQENEASAEASNEITESKNKKKSLKATKQKVDELKSVVEDEKKELTADKDEVSSSINRIRELEAELDSKIREIHGQGSIHDIASRVGQEAGVTMGKVDIDATLAAQTAEQINK
jgi:hypothetical protein